MAKRNQKKVSKLTIQEQYQSCPRANLFKRLGAYIYDLFALAAVLMFSVIFALLVVIIFNNMGLINLDAYKDIADYLSQSSAFAVYLAMVIIGFYAYFWTKGGQTIGMKAWRLRVQNSDGSNISFTQALIRLATSAFGLGNIMALLKNRNAFQDLWAECEVIVLTKELSSWKGFKGMGFMDEDKK
ncbi:RDD family protein [Psychromonas sp. psych-6C06]|uniref:RDD family protein n=1 Tax=Psychromonas sp. psych-6C06 TaxID=2058089 RepID=UPI000C34A433|nr:RDD family protein [Psychromonas sp. psych-6C06]PKF63011.1 RDD family protein [Psychromonas sp. psych-6C06]